MSQNNMKKHVIIAGGGFAGIQAARSLAKNAPKNTDIILISNKSYFEYYPALYRVVTGASPIEVCVPLEEMLPSNVEILVDTIVSVDPSKKAVVCKETGEYEADYLVLALGSETTYFDIPGIKELSFGFKSINEANKLKNHIVDLFKERKEAGTKKEDCVSHFRIVVVGGGPSGVEVSGDLAIFLRKVARLTGVDHSFITIELIESGPRLVSALPEKASVRIYEKLRDLGVNILLNRTVERREVEEVFLKDMTMKTKTVIWTAGTRINSLYSAMSGIEFSEKKRVLVDGYLQAKNQNNVYIVGDAAQTKYSGLAQTAIRDGRFVGKRISKLLRGSAARDLYKPKPNAFSIPVGNRWGVLVAGPIRAYGLLGYIVRHMIDMSYFLPILRPAKFLSLFFEGFKYRIRK